MGNRGEDERVLDRSPRDFPRLAFRWRVEGFAAASEAVLDFGGRLLEAAAAAAGGFALGLHSHTMPSTSLPKIFPSTRNKSDRNCWHCSFEPFACNKS